MSTFGTLTRVLVAILAVGFHGEAGSHDEPTGALDALADQADLIVRGRVARIEYGMSVKTAADEMQVPFTYVTYAIDEVLKGSAADGQSVTLRFLGGPIGNERIMVVQGVPLFDVGDEDVLFVRGNGSHACPLVRCGDGRFRAIGDQMYSDDGFEVLLNPAGQPVYGRRHRNATVDEHRVGAQQLRRLVKDEPDSVEAADGETERPGNRGEHMSKGRFTGFVSDRVKRRHSPEQLKSLPAVASARAQERVTFRGPKAGLPGRDPVAVAPRIEPRDAAERAELEALARNRWNPVLPRQAGGPET
ncbi:MAG: hypothetical protein EPO25_15775 [Gammaproteobacteria bacterium]|nr:MAG: hypothetical protein EPO25_15775 [Gammaproteobacteria bacterium]